MDITFKLPEVVLDPSPQQIQSAITDVGQLILNSVEQVKWSEESHKNIIGRRFSIDENIQNTKTLIDEVILSKIGPIFLQKRKGLFQQFL